MKTSGKRSRSVSSHRLWILVWFAFSLISNQHVARLEDTAPGFADLEPITPENASRLVELKEWDNPPGSFKVAWSPDGNTLVVGGGKGLRAYENFDFDVPLIMPEEGKVGRSLDLAFSPDGSLLATANSDEVFLLDVAANHILATLKHDFAQLLSFNHDGSVLASGSADGLIKLWDARTYAEIATLDSGYDNAVKDLTFSPVENRLASVHADGIRVWLLNEELSAQTGARVDPPDLLQVIATGPMSVAFSPDGTLLAAGVWAEEDENRRLWLWDVQAQLGLSPFSGTAQHVDELTFSQDGNLLAATGDDNTIRLWSLNGDEPIVILHAESPPDPMMQQIVSVAFSPEGTILASCGWDHVVRLWGIPSADMDDEVFTTRGRRWSLSG